MEQRKKQIPWWGIFLIVIASIAAIISSLFGAYLLCMKLIFDADGIKLIKSAIHLTQSVNEEQKYSSRFSESDFSSTVNEINGAVNNLITYSESDKYQINTNIESSMSHDIVLNSKQTGSFINYFLTKENLNKITFDTIEISFEIVQLEFSSLNDSSIISNVVIKMGLSSFKDIYDNNSQFKFREHLPSTFYFSSFCEIQLNETSFTYNVNHSSVEINNLTYDEILNILKVVNKYHTFFDVNSISTEIQSSIYQFLIGNNANKGFAYSLRDLGATGVSFEERNSAPSFVIKA